MDQLVFEVHYWHSEKPEDVDTFFEVLSGIEESGFKQFGFHDNPASNLVHTNKFGILSLVGNIDLSILMPIYFCYRNALLLLL